MPQPDNGRWRDVLLDKLDAQQKPARRSVAINLDDEQRSAILHAAEARGLSMAAFVRRAALAIAVHDLELDWDALNANEPRVRGYDDLAGDPIRAGGRGFGPWKITGLEHHGE